MTPVSLPFIQNWTGVPLAAKNWEYFSVSVEFDAQKPTSLLFLYHRQSVLDSDRRFYYSRRLALKPQTPRNSGTERLR